LTEQELKLKLEYIEKMKAEQKKDELEIMQMTKKVIEKLIKKSQVRVKNV